MDYNTQRKKMNLPEYGRNIQKLVDYAKTIEDREKRNVMAKTIVDIMGNIHPHFKDMADFKHKLWDHLLMISDFELDVDSPYEEPPKETLKGSPEPVPYDNSPIAYKHYGRTIELLIQEAAKKEEGEEKDALIEIISNHMKKNYLFWNKDTVSDDQIFDDFEELAENKVKINREKIKLSDSKDLLSKLRRKRNGRKNKNNQNSQ
jgi:hypothetical protein